MTIYLVIDYGQYEGMDVREYAYAVDALEEIEERKLRFQSPVTQIIQGIQLTLEELSLLATKEGT